ncbi:hypothetical protein D3C85_584720 [compost metagenome]
MRPDFGGLVPGLRQRGKIGQQSAPVLGAHVQPGLTAPARIDRRQSRPMPHIAGAMPRQQGGAQHVDAASLARRAFGQGAQPCQRGARHRPFIQRPPHGDVEREGGRAVASGQGLAEHAPRKGRFRLQLGRYDGVAASGMRLHLAGGPGGRGAPLRALIGGFIACGDGFHALGVAPLRHVRALRLECAQQALKARRDVRESGQHQLPGRGQPTAFQRPEHARVALVRVFGIDTGQRLAITHAPLCKTAIFVGIRARRHLQFPFVHQQVGIHGQPRGLAGVQQHAFGLFGADRFRPHQLRGKTVEAVGGHVVVRLERKFVGGFGEPGGQRQDARQFADLALLAQQAGQFKREPARQAVVDRQHQRIGGGQAGDVRQR